MPAPDSQIWAAFPIVDAGIIVDLDFDAGQAKETWNDCFKRTELSAPTW